MPKNKDTKKKEKSPKNVTKKTVIGKIVDKTKDMLTSVVGFHPIEGISKKNKILEAIFKNKEESEQESEQQTDDNFIDKKGRITLNRDDPDKFILELINKTKCISANNQNIFSESDEFSFNNYQYKPYQKERYEILKKLPNSTSDPEKNSLKKEISRLIDVPLNSLDSTKKFKLKNQDDFIYFILCLENFIKENKESAIKKEILPANVEEPIQKPEEKLEEHEQVAEHEQVDETEILVEPEPELLPDNSEETRKIFEDDEPSVTEEKIKIDTTPIPDIENIEKNELEKEQEEEPLPTDKSEFNNFMLNKELREAENIKNDEAFQFLYPEINDPNFNIKIAKHKEFNETNYDGKVYDIEEHAKKLCNTDFELTPHQLFVKNFLSMQTPYNCLLLYHGLGTGKTCSSIGIAEEMRSYMQQVRITQPILVIASPNVQQNYRLQLFDERKLKLESGLWKLNTCIGDSLLKEINPTNIVGVPKDRIIYEINGIINKNYRFMGYGELANYIKRIIQIPEGANFKLSEMKELKIKKIKKYFDNRLIIIDEVHNIRLSDDNKEESKTASLLMDVAKYASNMRLLMLSATPMYNSHKEVIWLTNLINTIDKNSTIRESDVFDKDGNFKEKKNTKNSEGGKELLIRKLTGYVSYVRGENPYTFPYRIYPDVFSPENSLNYVLSNSKYPSMQMNNREIEEPMEHIPVFITPIGEYQAKGYDFLMNHMRNKSYNVINKFGEERSLPTFENMDSFGYTYLLKPLEALDIVFPNPELDKIQDKEDNSTESEPNEYEDQRNEEIINNFIGKKGLSNVMKFTYQKSPYPNVYDYEYKSSILNNPAHGRIFHPDNIGKYSNKIAKICDCIKKSRGIVLIYSQYIEGSIVPLALALEEMGISRFSSESYAKPLFKIAPTEPIDSITLKPKSQHKGPNLFNAAKYVMITGNPAYSPNNFNDIKYVTNPNNTNGEKVKVVIISKAGSEGLDFKCIRQIHILDPWYNMNRVEQIIGRGVRNFSHCMLDDFKERNVEIYLHATLPRNDEETADLYVYRYAEKKAQLIGKVNRLLKEISVDCLLNIGQHNFTIDQLNSLANNRNMKIRVSSKSELIDFQIGDRDYSDICDYDKCATDFKCLPHAEIDEVISSTYNDDYAKMNYSTITKRIRDLFKKRIAYQRNQLINEINIIKQYPESQIDFALSRFINNKSEFVYDENGRTGYLINKDDYYIFQPNEITDENATIFERSIPVDYKRPLLELELAKPVESEVIVDENEHVKNKYTKIFNDIEIIFKNIDIAKANVLTKRASKETDWYINYGYVHHLLVEKHNIEPELLTKYVIYHYLDTLPLIERIVILRYYYSGEKTDFETNIYEKIISQYFNEKVVKVRGFNAIILSVDSEDAKKEGGRKRIYIQDRENKWIWSDAQPTDQLETKKQSVRMLLVNLQSLNYVFGFMQILKNNVIFKIMDTSVKTKVGANCGGESKKDVIKRINMISEIKYTYNEDTVDNAINAVNIVKIGLCIIMEIICRHNDSIRKNNKRWFLNLEQDPYQ
jgi:hypothetical protein